MIINWGDLTKVDTILQKISTPGFQVTIDTSHTFPNANDKNYITTIKLVDDDSILSTFTDTIHIKSGCPVVSIPGGGDTLFARVASSGGDTVLTVNGYDPNNSIVQYYWVLGGSLLDTSHSTSKTLIPSQKFYVAQNSVNTFMNGYSAVFAKDVDGNMGGDTFQIYFDGPPDSTTITFPSKDTNYVAKDTVILQWNGLDIHDSLITQFAIMVDWSDLTDRYDTLKGFSTAASYLNGNIFEYRFKPNTGGTHKIRIISKDRSGNEVWGKKREFGYPF
jgi:hypothetical protein